MNLLLIATMALIALQFTSGIGQWISEHQKATETVAYMQWLVGHIGLAPTIITTRMVIIVFFIGLYLLQAHFLLWLIVAAAAWYLYKTGRYVALWATLKKEASTVIGNEVNAVAGAVVQDVTKTIVTSDPAQSAATAAAAKGVDVSKM